MSILSKEKFITEILIEDFQGNLTECAANLGISRGYLHVFLHSDKARAGHKLINAVYNYCKTSGRKPEMYFFREKN